jgi:predicted nuclease with TOPRIM domain
MDALTLLRAYLAGDETAIMSRAHVEAVIAEIEKLRARQVRHVPRPPFESVEEVYAEIDRLRAELAAERERIAEMQAVEKLDGRAIDRLTRENAKLREALEPFAKAAENFDDFPIKDAEQWFAYSGTSSQKENGKGAITVGDLRRARAVLKETEK